MNTVYVKPAEGARIRQPDRGGAVMPDAGALVPRDSYYERLIVTRDVVETDPPAEETAAEPASPAPSRPPDGEEKITRR